MRNEKLRNRANSSSTYFCACDISDKNVHQPKYIVSSRGKFMLTHNGYKYVQRDNPTNGSNGIQTKWRCGYYINKRYVCTAKAATVLNCNGVESVTFNGVHCHEAL